LSKEKKALTKAFDALKEGYKIQVRKHEEFEIEWATKKTLYKQKIRELKCKGKGQVKEVD
jgi:hypothetical protein